MKPNLLRHKLLGILSRAMIYGTSDVVAVSRLARFSARTSDSRRVGPNPCYLSVSDILGLSPKVEVVDVCELNIRHAVDSNQALPQVMVRSSAYISSSLNF